MIKKILISKYLLASGTVFASVGAHEKITASVVNYESRWAYFKLLQEKRRCYLISPEYSDIADNIEIAHEAITRERELKIQILGEIRNGLHKNLPQVKR